MTEPMSRAERRYRRMLEWTIHNLMLEGDIEGDADAIVGRESYARIAHTCFEAGIGEQEAAGILVGAYLVRKRHALCGEQVD